METIKLRHTTHKAVCFKFLSPFAVVELIKLKSATPTSGKNIIILSIGSDDI